MLFLTQTNMRSTENIAQQMNTSTELFFNKTKCVSVKMTELRSSYQYLEPYMAKPISLVGENGLL